MSTEILGRNGRRDDRRGLMMAGELELPKWTRMSQRVNPPGF